MRIGKSIAAALLACVVMMTAQPVRAADWNWLHLTRTFAAGPAAIYGQWRYATAPPDLTVWIWDHCQRFLSAMGVESLQTTDQCVNTHSFVNGRNPNIVEVRQRWLLVDLNQVPTAVSDLMLAQLSPTGQPAGPSLIEIIVSEVRELREAVAALQEPPLPANPARTVTIVSPPPAEVRNLGAEVSQLQAVLNPLDAGNQLVRRAELSAALQLVGPRWISWPNLVWLIVLSLVLLLALAFGYWRWNREIRTLKVTVATALERAGAAQQAATEASDIAVAATGMAATAVVTATSAAEEARIAIAIGLGLPSDWQVLSELPSTSEIEALPVGGSITLRFKDPELRELSVRFVKISGAFPSQNGGASASGLQVFGIRGLVKKIALRQNTLLRILRDAMKEKTLVGIDKNGATIEPENMAAAA